MKDVDSEKMEQDIVSALREAGSWRKDNVQREVRITRGENLLFSFKIEPIDEDTWSKCRRQNTRNKGKRTEELGNSRFLSQVIYEATIDEDKARLWRNKDVWKKFNATNGADVVNIVLKPGEKTKIVETISDISGYDDNDTLDDIIKN